MIGKIVKYIVYVLLLSIFYVSFSLHSNISYVLSVEPESRKASRASSNQPEPSVYDAYRQLLTKPKPGTRGFLVSFVDDCCDFLRWLCVFVLALGAMPFFLSCMSDGTQVPPPPPQCPRQSNGKAPPHTCL